MSISHNTLNKIKTEHITPKPRWQFLLKEKLIWILSISLIFIGGLAFSVLIYLLKDNDWEVYKYTNQSLFNHILLSLPYLWFIILIIFILVAIYNVRHSKTGYRYSSYILAIGSIVGSMVLGGIMYAGGMGDRVDLILSRKLPYYNNFVLHRHDMWNRPRQGVMAGEIVNNRGLVNSLKIEDIKGRIWTVNIDSTTVIHPKLHIATTSQIRIIGPADLVNKIIKAQRIVPWRGRNMRFFMPDLDNHPSLISRPMTHN